MLLFTVKLRWLEVKGLWPNVRAIGIFQNEMFQFKNAMCTLQLNRQGRSVCVSFCIALASIVYCVEQFFLLLFQSAFEFL